MREIALAGKKAKEGPAFASLAVPDGAAKRGETPFKFIEHTGRSHRCGDFKRDLVLLASKILQMPRQNHADHESVWTSTETTAGRSRTIADQLSPASAEA